MERRRRAKSGERPQTPSRLECAHGNLLPLEFFSFFFALIDSTGAPLVTSYLHTQHPSAIAWVRERGLPTRLGLTRHGRGGTCAARRYVCYATLGVWAVPTRGGSRTGHETATHGNEQPKHPRPKDPNKRNRESDTAKPPTAKGKDSPVSHRTCCRPTAWSIDRDILRMIGPIVITSLRGGGSN